MDVYQAFGCALLMSFIYAYPFIISFLRYSKITLFLPEAIVCKMFFVILFFILFIRIIGYILCSVFNAILILFSEETKNVSWAEFGIILYNGSLYYVEGLFMAAYFFLFWVLRNSYRLAQMSTSDEFLLGNENVAHVARRQYELNMLIIILCVIAFYVIFILYAANLIYMSSMSIIYLSMGGVIYIGILALTLIYALKYSGNPASSLQYKTMLVKSRHKLIIFGITRIVHIILDILRAFNAFGVETIHANDDFGKSIMRLCLDAAIIFVTETVPLQFSLDDEFVNLFIRSEKLEEQIAPESIEAPLNSSVHNSMKISSYLVKEEEKSPGTQNIISYKDYTSKNLSIDIIRKKIHKQILSLKEVKVLDEISAEPNKLGKIFNASFEYAFSDKKIVVRLIEFAKTPSYIFENILQELAYRSDYPVPILAPVLGIIEGHKLAIILAKYELSMYKKIHESTIEEKEKAHLVLKIAEALSVLQSFSPPLAHGHLSPSNIFLEKGQIVIADYGFELLKKHAGLFAKYRNKSAYTAPELLAPKGTVVVSPTVEGDIYSLGVIVWEIYTQKQAFNVTERELREYVVDGDFRPQMPDNIPRPIAKLIRSCWQKDPSTRPSISEVCRLCRSLVT